MLSQLKIGETCLCLRSCTLFSSSEKCLFNIILIISYSILARRVRYSQTCRCLFVTFAYVELSVNEMNINVIISRMFVNDLTVFLPEYRHKWSVIPVEYKV